MILLTTIPNTGLMALHEAGLLRGRLCPFLHVARIDMIAPETLSKCEKMLVLRHNVAWEHYLLNFTNFSDLMDEIDDASVKRIHVESLFPLPARWPWLAPPRGIEVAGQMQVKQLPARWARWREKHNFLYDDA
jgi:hypothetical protein